MRKITVGVLFLLIVIGSGDAFHDLPTNSALAQSSTPLGGGSGCLIIQGVNMSNTSGVYAYNISTGTIVYLDFPVNILLHDISDDGSKLLYSEYTSQDMVGLFVSNIDGNNKVMIAEGESEGIDNASQLFGAAWSPDETQIAFAPNGIHPDSGARIQWISSDGQDFGPLTWVTKSRREPLLLAGYLPDGRIIANEWNGEYIVVARQGGGVSKNWSEIHTGLEPNRVWGWSSDGKKWLVFTGNWDTPGDMKLYIFDSDTLESTEIASYPYIFFPRFSPDNKYIAFDLSQIKGSDRVDIGIYTMETGDIQILDVPFAGNFFWQPATSEWDVCNWLFASPKNDNVNIRSGPSTNDEILGQLRFGTSATIVGKNADNSWLQIRFQDDTGWVFAELIDVSGDMEQIPVVEAE